MKTYLTKTTLYNDPNPGTPSHIKQLLEKDNGVERVEVVDVEGLIKEFEGSYEYELLNKYGSVFAKTVTNWLRERLTK